MKSVAIVFLLFLLCLSGTAGWLAYDMKHKGWFKFFLFIDAGILAMLFWRTFII